MYALLDSESVTGAFRFTIRPLETTIIDTEMTLIARVATDKLGIGAHGGELPLQRPRSPAPGRLARGGLRSHRPSDPLRQGRVAVAAGVQPRHPADLGLFRRQPARLRTAAALAQLRRLLRRRRPMGAAADALDRADRRLGRRRRAAARDSGCRRRPTPTSSPSGAPRRALRPAQASRSPIVSSGAGRRRRSRRWPFARRAAPARPAAGRASPSK